MIKTFQTNSLEETQQIASDLAKTLNSGIIALSGELGAGKTTFTQGFAKGLGIEDKIISPTFVLMRQHPIPNRKQTLFHIDLYRLENNDDFKSIGLDDILNSQDIALIEWSEKLDTWPDKTIFIKLKSLSENSREITIQTPDL